MSDEAIEYTRRSPGCFGCGEDNPAGLRLAPRVEGDEVVAELTPAPEHRSMRAVVHGGVSTTALDEVIGAAVGRHVSCFCATVRIEVEFRRPFLIGTTATVRGRYVEDLGGGQHRGEGELLDAGGKVLARASATFAALNDALIQKFIGRE